MFMDRRSSTHAALLLLLALCAATPGVARAQQPPQPAPEITRITALAGNFEGEAAYTAGGRTLKFTLHHVNRVIAKGFGLATHEEAELPGLGHYEAENLFGWDAGRRQLHLFTVTNDPIAHDHAGPWTDATHATLRYEGLSEGKRIVEVLPIEIVSPNEYRFRSTTTKPGQAPEVFEATMKRVDGLAGR